MHPAAVAVEMPCSRWSWPLSASSRIQTQCSGLLRCADGPRHTLGCAICVVNRLGRDNIVLTRGTRPSSQARKAQCIHHI